MEFDSDGDGIYEANIEPLNSIIIDESENFANVNIVKLIGNAQIDLTNSVGAIITINDTNLTNETITIQKIEDNSLDSPSFFTIDSFLNINISENNTNYTLSIIYPDYISTTKHLSENSFSIYDKDTQQIISSTTDQNLNRVSAVIQNSGNYLVATTDQTPFITNIQINPDATNIVGSNVFVSANIVDDGIINNVFVTLLNTTENMTPNGSVYEANLIGPINPGLYPVIITAEDDNNDIVTSQTSFLLDLEAPIITINSPEEISYITNRIDLDFFVNEDANITYLINGAFTNYGEVSAFEDINIPLIFAAGNHTINITATDVFGNSDTKSVSFFVEQENIQVSNLDLNIFEKINTPFEVSADITNTMIDNVTNVSVNLLVNNSITNTTTINLTGEETKNIDFILTLPEGRYEIKVESTPLNNENFVDDNFLTREILITDKIPVLLVNDDITKDNSIYQNAILNSGLEYIDYSVAENGLPDQEFLDLFSLIIWLTGGQETLTGLEQNILTNYLDNFGNLLIFSENLGSNIGTSEFYRDYLFAEYKKPAETRTIEGSFRDIIGNGLLFSLTQSGEEVTLLGDSTESLRYSGGDSAAIKTETNTFKTSYFTFPLENIEDQTLRRQIFDRTIQFFDIDIFPPVILNKNPELDENLPINTNDLTLSLETNEISECRYSFSDESFNELIPFDQTNSLIHLTNLSNLTNGLNYTVYFSCRDVYNNQVDDIFRFFIYNRTFNLPILEQVPDINASENDTINITLNVTDPDNDTLNITIEDVEIFGLTPIANRFIIQDKSLIITNNFQDSGLYRLTVNVDDGFDIVSDTFDLFIENVNKPPVLDPIGNKVLLEDVFFFFDVNASDPDNDSLSFADNTSLFIINPGTGAIGFTPGNDDIGTHLINISVSDGDLIDYEEIILTITNSNDPPLIEPILPQEGTEGIPFILQINASDPDNDSIFFSDDTDLFDISTDGLINFTPNNSAVGSNIITITVTDTLETDDTILNLLINDVNSAPVILSITDPINVIVGGSFILDLEACDPDEDPGCIG